VGLFHSVPAGPGTEHEERCTGQSKEEDVNGHHIVKDLFISTRYRHDYSPDTLQHYRNNRHSRSRVETAYCLEEDAVTCHRIVDPWSSENALTEKTDGRDGDPARDDRCSAPAKSGAHHLRRR